MDALKRGVEFKLFVVRSAHPAELLSSQAPASVYISRWCERTPVLTFKVQNAKFYEDERAAQRDADLACGSRRFVVVPVTLKIED